MEDCCLVKGTGKAVYGRAAGIPAGASGRPGSKVSGLVQGRAGQGRPGSKPAGSGAEAATVKSTLGVAHMSL